MNEKPMSRGEEKKVQDLNEMCRETQNFVFVSCKDRERLDKIPQNVNNKDDIFCNLYL